MTRRPVIYITGPRCRGNVAYAATALGVWLAGGRPRRIRAAGDQQAAPAPDGLIPDGLILGGGTDIHPKYYRGEVKTGYAYDGARDEMEFALLAEMERTDKPVLGICRGAQLINIHRGGTLHPDVSKAYEKARYPGGLAARIFYRKRMRVEKGSLLATLLRGTRFRVNSLHTQAIERPGGGLVVAARERNGVIQAVEDPGRRYFLGVQFHPEYLIYSAIFRRLFRGVVAAAARGPA